MLRVLSSTYAVGVTSRFSVQIVAFVQVMIASRYLDLAGFGVYALAWAVTVIANSFVYTGFYQALLRSTDIGRDRDTVFWAMLGIGAVGAAVIGTAGVLAGGATGFSAGDWVTGLSGAGVGATGLAMIILAPVPVLKVLVAWNEAQLVRDKRVRTASAHVVISESVALVVMWVGLRVGYGLGALIAARYASTLIEMAVTSALVRRRPRTRIDRAALGDSARTALPLWGATAMGMFSNYGADLILGAFLNPAAVGAYRGGARISQTVSDLILQPLVMLSWSGFTQLEKAGQLARIREAWLGNMAFGAASMWPILASVALLAPEIVTVVFDATWAPAAVIVSILCLARAVRFASALLEPVMICHDQGRRQLRIRMIGAVALLAFLLGFGRIGGEAAAWAQVATAAVVAVLSLLAMLPLLKIDAAALLRAFAPGLGLTGLCAGVVLATAGWRAGVDPATGLAVTVGALALLWAALVAIGLQRRILVLPLP
jgi:O-antigen/teichoic acid export membrane protein